MYHEITEDLNKLIKTLQLTKFLQPQSQSLNPDCRDVRLDDCMALLSGTFFQVARVGSPSMTHLMAGSKSSGMWGHSVALTFAKTRLYYNPFREDISARN